MTKEQLEEMGPEELISYMGWNDESQKMLLEKFIEKKQLNRELEKFLEEQAIEELEL